jgi:hypothetical protein
MKVCSGILKRALINQTVDEHFHFYNSLTLTDDIVFQRTHFRKSPTNMRRIYTPDAATDDDKPPLQTRTHDQNNKLLKIAILIVSNTSAQEITQAILDLGALCCATPYFEDFLNQPTPIQNTTLKVIYGGLVDLGRGTIHIKVKQNNKYGGLMALSRGSIQIKVKQNKK